MSAGWTSRPHAHEQPDDQCVADPGAIGAADIETEPCSERYPFLESFWGAERYAIKRAFRFAEQRADCEPVVEPVCEPFVEPD